MFHPQKIEFSVYFFQSVFFQYSTLLQMQAYELTTMKLLAAA